MCALCAHVFARAARVVLEPQGALKPRVSAGSRTTIPSERGDLMHQPASYSRASSCVHCNRKIWTPTNSFGPLFEHRAYQRVVCPGQKVVFERDFRKQRDFRIILG